MKHGAAQVIHRLAQEGDYVGKRVNPVVVPDDFGVLDELAPAPAPGVKFAFGDLSEKGSARQPQDRLRLFERPAPRLVSEQAKQQVEFVLHLF
jgi:hypothetical protein